MSEGIKDLPLRHTCQVEESQEVKVLECFSGEHLAWRKPAHTELASARHVHLLNELDQTFTVYRFWLNIVLIETLLKHLLQCFVRDVFKQGIRDWHLIEERGF